MCVYTRACPLAPIKRVLKKTTFCHIWICCEYQMMIWYVLTPVLTLLFANTGKRFIWRTEPFIQHVDPQQLRSRHQSSCTGPWISMVSKSCQVRPSVIFQRRVGYLFCLERLGGGFASNKKNIQTKIVHAFPDSKMNGLFNHANPPWCL